MIRSSALPIDSLAAVPPFSELPKGERRELEQHCQLLTLPSKETLFSEGDEPTAGFCVLSGRMLMIKGSRNGKELIVQLVPPGELFGLVAFLDGQPFPLSSRAHCDSTVARIPKMAIKRLIGAHPELMRAFAELVTRRMRGTHDMARALAHDKIETRIASVLVSLIPSAEATKDGDHVIRLGRQDLADIVGTTIETASRVMKSYERDGVVDVSSPGIVIVRDMKVLTSLTTAE